VIATAAGGILAVRGLTSSDKNNVSTWVGLGGAAVGLPLAIGPFVGTGTVLEPGTPAPDVHRPGPNEACGERPLVASAALLMVRGIEVYGTIDHDGVFSVSPFQLLDAYDLKAAEGWGVTADVYISGRAPHQITTVLDAGAMAAAAPAFLAHADFDAKIQPMRVVPGIVAGTLRASLTSTAAGAALRIVLPLKNDGPGPASGLRGLVASSTKAVDGRVLYVGALAAGTSITRELLVPLSPDAADALRGSTIELSVELRDAHGTAPETPVRFKGMLLGDAPR
jgi:hypothetical protein